MPALSAISDISRHPSLAYYYAQKAIRGQGLRNAMGSAVARLVGPAGPALEQVPGSAEVAAELDRNGICFLPQLQLGEQQLADVRGFLRGKPVVDWYDGKLVDIDGDVPKDCSKLGYRTYDLVQCQTLLSLANSPLVLSAVAKVLGAQPSIGRIQAWWILGENYAPGQEHYDDIYHRDVDDLRFVKLFAYLTDTGPNNGAHSFVRGSHRRTEFARRGPITDEQVHETFAPEDIMTITGKAGTVFLENTWGIHRPLLATEGRRLIFSALYGLTPWVPRGPHDVPNAPAPKGVDPYINRALFTRRAG